MLIGFDGERLKNTYSYPQGYLVEHPAPNLRTVLLLEMFADMAGKSRHLTIAEPYPA